MVSHNLPLQSTPFVDRTQELADIAQRLVDPTCRLLTLVGPGGIGKTRLALRAAADYASERNDDVYFVSLVSVGSPGLIASAIASALNISLYSPDDPSIQLANALQDKTILLVIDNFEPLLDGVGLLVDLLGQASRLKFMVTSRERLNLQEEWVLPIEGMHYPTEDNPQDIHQFSAVCLFMQSARRIQPAFVLENNLQAVIEICQQVEGMPLAIELAASWLRVMPCDQIASQLKRSLDFLTTPLRNVPERHRSLRAVFDHSWDLLCETERDVLMKLSIFRSGFDLAAAEDVARASLPILAALVDKSLIRVTASGRYDLHELLRQYSAEKLLESSEATLTAQRHLNFFLKLAERAESDVYGPQQTVWFERLEDEHGNLHAALSWSLNAHEAETGLRLAAALGWFWQLRGHLREGSQWYERLLEATAGTWTLIRAKALHRASEVETQSNNSTRGQRLAEESLALARTLDDPWNTAWALAALGLAGMNGQMVTKPVEQALALFRDLNDRWGISHTLRRLALFLEHAGEPQRAVGLAEEALSLARAAEDKSAMAWSLYALGFAHWQNDFTSERAVHFFREALPLFRAIRDVNGLSMTLDLLGAQMLIRGNHAQARRYFEENLSLTLELTWIPKLNNANSLAGFAILFSRQADYAPAATLLATFEKYFDLSHDTWPTFFLDALLETCRTECRDPQYAAAWTEGSAMTVPQAAAFALQHASSNAEPSHTLVEPLSERELEVVRLLAHGLSNAQIAQKLFLSVGTIKAHTRNIYGKLGVNSRTQAIAQAQLLNLI